MSEWFKTYYTPSNAVLVMAGDITAAEAREKARAIFGDIPPGPPVAHQRGLDRQDDRRRIARASQDRVPQARIYKIWNMPGQTRLADGDYLRWPRGILSQRQKFAPVQAPGLRRSDRDSGAAYLDEREIGGQFVVVATARQGEDLRKVEKALDEELARFLEERPHGAGTGSR